MTGRGTSGNSPWEATAPPPLRTTTERVTFVSSPPSYRNSTANPGGLETVHETHDVMSVNRSLESATDSFTLTFLAPRGANVLDAKDELK